MNNPSDKIEASVYCGIGCFLLLIISSVIALIWALIYLILSL